MGTINKTDQRLITIELANAIASFNIEMVAELLSETGQFSVQNEEDEIAFTDKPSFIKWLNSCFDAYIFVNDGKTKLNYVLDQCLHCRIGNPVIIFENGRFPVFMRKSWEREKCGLMLEFDENLISGITFCFVFLKTDNPYLFEKKCSRQNL